MIKKEKFLKIKGYFLIINIFVAIFSFSFLVSADSKGDQAMQLLPQVISQIQMLDDSTQQNPTTLPVASSGSPQTSNPSSTPGNGVGETQNPPKVQEVRVNGWDFLNQRYGTQLEQIKSIDPNTYNQLQKDFSNAQLIINEEGQVQSPGGSSEEELEEGGSFQKATKDYLSKNLIDNLKGALAGAALGGLVGTFAGGEDGLMWGSISGFAGGVAYQLAKKMTNRPFLPALIGISVGVGIFLATYKKEVVDKVEFHCLPWQAPLGGKNCELCNDLAECSEYTCKSLGQACSLVNEGTEDQKCIWQNPYDTNSPIIKMIKASEGHEILPANNIRPTSTGVEIKPVGRECLKAFTPLEFTFTTKDSASGLGEPSQCKIDYNLTISNEDDVRAGFEEMAYFVGGDNAYKYNHTEELSLPGPDNLEKTDPGIKNDGTYTLYIRCQDANGNFNQDAFSVKFCVDPGPDTTPPRIDSVSIPSQNPIQFNKTNLDLEVYVNEPAECKWSRVDQDYDSMENEMECGENLWDMNEDNLYTCKVKLTGIENRKENQYYFRCKDQPYSPDADRNPNTQSYGYMVIGTQPLNILSISPKDETISGATDTIPVFITVTTDNGFNNGQANCYYSTTGNEEDYIQFLESNSTNVHKQRQDLTEGDYTYYLKCIDLAGNAVYNQTSFSVVSDKSGPQIVRFYSEGGELKIISEEEAECSYSFIDCNFEIDDGIKMSSLDHNIHHAEWKSNFNYYIRCKDKYNNQPDPNVCSIVVRPTDLKSRLPVIEL